MFLTSSCATWGTSLGQVSGMLIDHNHISLMPTTIHASVLGPESIRSQLQVLATRGIRVLLVHSSAGAQLLCMLGMDYHSALWGEQLIRSNREICTTSQVSPILFSGVSREPMCSPS